MRPRRRGGLDVGADVADHARTPGRRRPSCGAAASTMPGPRACGRRSRRSGACGHTCQVSNGPSSSSTRALTASTCAAGEQAAADAGLVGDHADRHARARAAGPAPRARRRHRLDQGRVAVVGDVVHERAVPVEQHRRSGRRPRPALAVPPLARAAGAPTAASGITDAGHHHRGDLGGRPRARGDAHPGELGGAGRSQPQPRPASRRHGGCGRRSGGQGGDGHGAGGDGDVPGQPAARAPARVAPVAAVQPAHQRVVGVAAPARARLTQRDAGRTGCVTVRRPRAQPPAGVPHPQRQVGVLAVRPGEPLVEAAAPRTSAVAPVRHVRGGPARASPGPAVTRSQSVGRRPRGSGTRSRPCDPATRGRQAGQVGDQPRRASRRRARTSSSRKRDPRGRRWPASPRCGPRPARTRRLRQRPCSR